MIAVQIHVFLFLSSASSSTLLVCLFLAKWVLKTVLISHAITTLICCQASLGVQLSVDIPRKGGQPCPRLSKSLNQLMNDTMA